MAEKLDRYFEPDPVEMRAKLDNIGRRADDIKEAALKAVRTSPTLGIQFQERALSLVAECGELGCPPPHELIAVLAIVFAPSGERRARADDVTNIAGSDPAGVMRRYQQRLVAEEWGIKVNSVAKFRAAAAVEAASFDVETGTFMASVNSVATASGAAHKSIKDWREKFPKYAELTRCLALAGS